MRIGSRERPESATRYAASLLGAEFASQELCRFWSGAAREAFDRAVASEQHPRKPMFGAFRPARSNLQRRSPRCYNDRDVYVDTCEPRTTHETHSVVFLRAAGLFSEGQSYRQLIVACTTFGGSIPPAFLLSEKQRRGSREIEAWSLSNFCRRLSTGGLYGFLGGGRCQ
jgi:hypothetical protein